MQTPSTQDACVPARFSQVLADEDAAATEYVTQSYAKAFGALAGLPEGSEVQEITGDDMLSCCRAAGLSLTPLVRMTA